MWIMTTEGFLSCVSKAPAGPDELLVRARTRAHLATHFPHATIIESTHTDYRFRAVIARTEVAQLAVSLIMSIDYGNFKGAVQERDYEHALHGVWDKLEPLQPGGAYNRRAPFNKRGMFADDRGRAPAARQEPTSSSRRLNGERF